MKLFVFVSFALIGAALGGGTPAPKTHLCQELTTAHPAAKTGVYLYATPDKANFNFKDIAKLAVALLDSIGAHPEDLFTNESLRIATYQLSTILSAGSKLSLAEPALIAELNKVLNEAKLGKHQSRLNSIIAQWGELDSLAAYYTDVVVDITNRLLHKKDSDNKLAKACDLSNAKPVPPTDICPLLDEILQVRVEIDTCYNEAKKDLVPVLDSVILCEAFAYSTRGFPDSAEEAQHDDDKDKYAISYFAKLDLILSEDLEGFGAAMTHAVATYNHCLTGGTAASDTKAEHELDDIDTKVLDLLKKIQPST